MQSNLVSIITPIYNGEKYIAQCIESVLSQSYENIEMIIINDGSTDKSEEIIKKYMDDYYFIKYIKLEKNKGISVARNKGIEIAKGRFIAFLDCDDLFKKDKIKKQLEFMLKNNYSFTYTSYDLINDNNDELGKIIYAEKYEDYSKLLKGNNIGCLTVMIDRLNINLPIEFQNYSHEDYILWLNILKKNNIAYGLNEVLSSYRKTKNSTSHNKIKAAKWTWNIYRRVEKLSFIKSLYLFMNYTINGLIKK